MSLMLVKPAMIGLLLAASHPSLPTIDFRRTCTDLSGAGGTRRCIDEELYARRKLLKYWSRTPDSYKRQCILDPMPPYPSYTVLRDCINNNVILRALKDRPRDAPGQFGTSESFDGKSWPAPARR